MRYSRHFRKGRHRELLQLRFKKVLKMLDSEEKKKIRWKTICEEYYTDSSGKPVAVKFNSAIIEGFTRYGVAIQYSDRFLSFNIADLKKLYKALEKLIVSAESMLKKSLPETSIDY